VNWDAKVDIDTINGRIGVGIVVRDYEGHVVGARSLTKMKNLELVAAEALTAFQNTVFSKDLELQNYFVRWRQMVNITKLTWI